MNARFEHQLRVPGCPGDSLNWIASPNVPPAPSRAVPHIPCVACPASPSVPRSMSRNVPQHAVPGCPAVCVPECPAMHVSVPGCPAVPQCPSVPVPECPASPGTRRLGAPEHPAAHVDATLAEEPVNAGRRGAGDHVHGCIFVPFGANSAFSDFGTPGHPQDSGSTPRHPEESTQKSSERFSPSPKTAPNTIKNDEFRLKINSFFKSSTSSASLQGRSGDKEPEPIAIGIQQNTPINNRQLTYMNNEKSVVGFKPQTPFIVKQGNLSIKIGTESHVHGGGRYIFYHPTRKNGNGTRRRKTYSKSLEIIKKRASDVLRNLMWNQQIKAEVAEFYSMMPADWKSLLPALNKDQLRLVALLSSDIRADEIKSLVPNSINYTNGLPASVKVVPQNAMSKGNGRSSGEKRQA